MCAHPAAFTRYHIDSKILADRIEPADTPTLTACIAQLRVNNSGPAGAKLLLLHNQRIENEMKVCCVHITIYYHCVSGKVRKGRDYARLPGPTFPTYDGYLSHDLRSIGLI
jgi:hypothetical protein